jgi:hypothetical protein
VCVCVCERERERERMGGGRRLSIRAVGFGKSPTCFHKLLVKNQSSRHRFLNYRMPQIVL